MRLTWLGWAGVELELDGETLVIDPLLVPEAAFGVFGERAAGTPLPAVVPATAGRAVAGLVTHLHRDHADADALTAALAPGALVLEPSAGGGGDIEEMGVAQPEWEFRAAGLKRRKVMAWESTTIGPFTATALPAVDGLGDPQVAWAVAGGGVRVLHLGDTMFHGAWWRMALRHGPFDVVLLPVNGVRVRYPHRRPASELPVVMDPTQAAVAAQLLGARLAVPIHAEGFEIGGIYEPMADTTERFLSAAAERGVPARALAVGGSFEIPVVAAAVG